VKEKNNACIAVIDNVDSGKVLVDVLTKCIKDDGRRYEG
jgi:hypothetical protein